MTISEFRRAVRNGPYAWPGGYPLYWVMGDGAALAWSCCKTERRAMLEALHPANFHIGRYEWLPVALEVNWEDSSLYCAHTNARIESAYAEESAQ